MAMTATFYNINKRRNSMALPSGDGWEIEVRLKDGCSFINPVFLLETDDFDYNYASFNGRYYWVDEIRSVRNGLFSIGCSVDCLATYASDIKSTTAHVSYSSSAYDLEITDGRIVPKNTKTFTYSNTKFNFIDATGCFLLGVYGGNGSSMFSTYALTQSQMESLASIFSASDALADIAQYFYDPISLVAFLRWMPIGIDRLSGDSSRIMFGSYNSGVDGKLLTDYVYSESITIQPARKFNDFRDYEPYAEGTLFLPGVGVVPFSLKKAYSSFDFSCNIYINLETGSCDYVLADATVEIATYSATMGISFPVSSTSHDWGKIISGALTVLSSAVDLGTGAATMIATGGAVGLGNVISSLADSFGGIVNLTSGVLKSNISYTGGFSSGISFKYDPYISIIIFYWDTADTPAGIRAIMGNALHKVRSISGLSGYCQTRGFDVAGTMTNYEKAVINASMDGGVYIE